MPLGHLWGQISHNFYFGQEYLILWIAITQQKVNELIPFFFLYSRVTWNNVDSFPEWDMDLSKVTREQFLKFHIIPILTLITSPIDSVSKLKGESVRWTPSGAEGFTY